MASRITIEIYDNSSFCVWDNDKEKNNFPGYGKGMAPNVEVLQKVAELMGIPEYVLSEEEMADMTEGEEDRNSNHLLPEDMHQAIDPATAAGFPEYEHLKTGIVDLGEE